MRRVLRNVSRPADQVEENIAAQKATHDLTTKELFWRWKQSMLSLFKPSTRQFITATLVQLERRFGKTKLQDITAERLQAYVTSVAKALGTSIRELMGSPAVPEVELVSWIDRIRKIVGSRDQAAIQAMQNGLENAELLLARGFRGSIPPLVVKGEDAAPNSTFWSQLPIKRKLGTAGKSRKTRESVPKAVRKAQ